MPTSATMPHSSQTAEGEALDCTWGNENACDNYQEVSTQYDFHTYCNLYTTMYHLGELKGRKVLDLPSGHGVYACKMLAAGASWVTSADIDKNFIATARRQVNAMSSAAKWHGVEANASIPTTFRNAPFDVARVNFLLENFHDMSDMRACAQNIFNNLRAGGRYVGIWAPGAHTPEDGRIVSQTVGMKTSDITGMKSGDLCRITYVHLNNQGSYQWYLKTEDDFRRCLESVGFENIRFERLLVDPAYRGSDDLDRFVGHVGNRIILADKPRSLP